MSTFRSLFLIGSLKVTTKIRCVH